MPTTTNIIFRHSALDGIDFKESIDLGLVCAAFDHQVNLIFVDAGVNSLIAGQTAQDLDDKNQVDIIKGLEFYDIDNVLLEQESVENCSLEVNQLIDSVQIKSRQEILKLNLAADHLVIL